MGISAAATGLARSFLFAGVRSLLVSYWQVIAEVAPKLTVETIRAQQQHPS